VEGLFSVNASQIKKVLTSQLATKGSLINWLKLSKIK
jgi:hypothetical protein